MQASAVLHRRFTPSAATASVVSALLVLEHEGDALRVVIPSPQIQLAVRIGPSARHGLDLHALGVRDKAHRKLIRGGQRTILAQLQLGAHEAVLGVPAAAVVGRIVPLEDLWGDAATRLLRDRLAAARDQIEVADILERAIAKRIGIAKARPANAQLALDAAARLGGGNVGAVAAALGVSERHLRRVFRDTVGLSAKTFAKLTRFHCALEAARRDAHASWASIAVLAGYYDQAHLIREFRGIAGVTPRALLGELAVAPLPTTCARSTPTM